MLVKSKEGDRRQPWPKGGGGGGYFCQILKEPQPVCCQLSVQNHSFNRTKQLHSTNKSMKGGTTGYLWKLVKVPQPTLNFLKIVQTSF
jgi:hypothetical protein